MAAVSDKIIINFGWKGASSWRGGHIRGGADVSIVNLVFKNAKTEINVNIPDLPDGSVPSLTVQKLPFTCRKINPVTETHPETLKVTIEQIQNLMLSASIFVANRTENRPIKLVISEELEVGKTYSLIVTSDDSSFSARLLKEEVRADGAMKDEGRDERKSSRTEQKATADEFRSRLGKMGAALIGEGLENLALLARGGAGVFDSSSTQADVFAHGVRGLARAGQHMHPDIAVPHSKPSEKASDLDKLTPEELQSRFEAACIKDKELETQRVRAVLDGNITEMNRILDIEQANSQLLMNLAEVLERKGFKAQMPQSKSFQSSVSQSADAHDEALKGLQDQCKMQ